VGFNRLLILSILFFCLLLPLSASAADESTGGAKKRIRVDIDSNGSKIELQPGDEIQIELQGAGGTGYAWYFDELDNDFFELIHEGRKIQGKGGALVGSPTLYTWVFKAKKIGKSIIRMSYYRIWEGKDSAVRRFEVEITIVP
jgi:predicted secreted protein